MTAQPFPADPAFPQLKIASDPVLMRELFQRHLRPLSSEAYHIRECMLTRVRYREGSRCVLQYTQRLVHPRTGRERNQWVTGVLYAEPDRAERIWQRLAAGGPSAEMPEPLRTFEPVSFIRDLRMLVEVFPYDRRLPGLLLAMSRSPELEALLGAQLDSEWHAEEWAIEPIRYRAELGAVLRYVAQTRDKKTGREEQRRFYVKIYDDEEEGEHTYGVLQALWRKAENDRRRSGAGDCGPRDGFTVGRPIAYLNGLRALIQEEAPGTLFMDSLREGRDTAAAMRKVARALAAFHLDEVITTRRHSRQDEIIAVEKARRLLQWACPPMRAEVESIADSIVAGLEESPPCATHRDLKTDHILLNDDRLALLDLDYFAAADPVLDPAALLAQLAGMPLRITISPDRVRAATDVFVEEYFTHVPEAWRGRFALHYAGALLKEAVGFFRRQEPDWFDKIPVLVRQARESVAGRVS